MKCPICSGQCGPFICTQNVDRTSEVSEIDRLRAEIERLRVLGPDTEARITVEACEIATAMLKPVVDSWRAEVERVRADERAAIVAWLHQTAAAWGTEGSMGYAADLIESGEHLKGAKKP